MAKHRPVKGSWIPDPKLPGNYIVVGPITRKLLGRETGWDEPRS